MRRLPLLLAILLGLARAEEAPKPLIAVSNYPLQWVCETLVGDQATVINLTKDAANPREWIPDDAGLQTLKQADVVVLQGGGYEIWAKDVELPQLFRSSEAVFVKYSEARKLGEEDAALFYQRVGGRAWLDPLHLELQAEAIAVQLRQKHPAWNLEAAMATIRKDLAAMGQGLPHAHRLQTGWVMGLDTVFEHTLARAYGWNIRTAPQGFRTEDPNNARDWEQFGEFFEFFPARLAIRRTDRGRELAKELQNVLQIHASPFNTLDKNPDPAKTYPVLMRENFTLLTSGFSP